MDFAAPPPCFHATDMPWRRRPAEYYPGRGWQQGGEKLRNVKPHYHWIWPKDGKRGSTLGRWKDLLDDRGPDGSIAWKPWWVAKSRPYGLPYDFATRTYRRPYHGMWTDALWQEEPNRHFKYPAAFRTLNGVWYHDLSATH